MSDQTALLARRPILFPLHLKLHPVHSSLPPAQTRDAVEIAETHLHHAPACRRSRHAPVQDAHESSPAGHVSALRMAAHPARGAEARRRSRPAPHRAAAGVFVPDVPVTREHVGARGPRHRPGLVHRSPKPR